MFLVLPAAAQVGAELERGHVALAVADEQDGVLGVEHHAREACLLGALRDTATAHVRQT